MRTSRKKDENAIEFDLMKHRSLVVFLFLFCFRREPGETALE